LITSLPSKKKPSQSASQKPIEGDATGNETGPETMSGELAPTQNHVQPVQGPLIDECEYGETVMYRDRTYSVKQRWTRLVATTDRRALLARESIVPQAVLTVRLRPLHPPLVQPLIYLLHHILKIHKETAAADLQAHIEASQTRTGLEMRSGHIAHVRHLPLKHRLTMFAAISLTHSKLYDGKKAP
jgi:hypothetical protein